MVATSLSILFKVAAGLCAFRERASCQFFKAPIHRCGYGKGTSVNPAYAPYHSLHVVVAPCFFYIIGESVIGHFRDVVLLSWRREFHDQAIDMIARDDDFEPMLGRIGTGDANLRSPICAL
jgi:hypothetical protein